MLIVEDEPNILELLTASLRLSGFTTRGAACGDAAAHALDSFTPDIALLDVMLPDRDGFAVAGELRAAVPGLPVLFLTARAGVADRVAGLRAGADDYVTKPFSLEEVVLRINAILRRTGTSAGGGPGRGEPLRYADLELDEDLHEVRRAGRAIRLSPTEFNLLRYLMANAESVLSKPQIMDRVWGQDAGDSRVVESYISYLRRKIDAAGEPLIHTVWGVGYSLRLAGARTAVG
ncbi:two-component system OmpR family response regulator [Actinorugispora endophytica]|uniref:Two-component system OmpR family response regulator n=1 Tax=Actinorugispora endophytica TaxID=1605990 RepID=A0A4R6V904_9ACTN|nr:two-component system OmpR family response regulator [Actinorugispora endophytica]